MAVNRNVAGSIPAETALGRMHIVNSSNAPIEPRRRGAQRTQEYVRSTEMATAPQTQTAALIPAAAGGAGKPQSDLVDAVRHWVHFDNLAESLTKQVTNARNMRAQFEEKVLRLLDTAGMRNAVLQITGATLQRQTRSKAVDLSWTLLEEQLHEYYKSKGRVDETKAILEFLQTHRGSKTVDYLKKTPK